LSPIANFSGCRARLTPYTSIPRKVDHLNVNYLAGGKTRELINSQNFNHYRYRY